MNERAVQADLCDWFDEVQKDADIVKQVEPQESVAFSSDAKLNDETTILAKCISLAKQQGASTIGYKIGVQLQWRDHANVWKPAECLGPGSVEGFIKIRKANGDIVGCNPDILRPRPKADSACAGA